MAARVRDARLALPAERAAALAGVSMRQLRYWDGRGIVQPSVRRALSERTSVRLYDFTDLLALLVAAQLRRRISLQQIGKVVRHLRDLGFERPLNELRYAVVGGEVYVQFPDGTWEGGLTPGQVVIHQVIDLRPLRAQLREAARRPVDADGHVVRRRARLGGKPVFAGTRIPVAPVRGYLDSGHTTDDILRVFPTLKSADIEAARTVSA